MDIPAGYKFSVAEAAVKAPGRKDMALICSDRPAVLAGVFTANRVKAAPVTLDMVRARKGICRAIVVNSGNANACTGVQGMKDAREMAALVAEALGGAPEEQVYVCSTGVIGVPMPMTRIRPAMGALAGALGSASAEDVARTIMTTDTFPKFASVKVKAGAVTGTVMALCKGAGMIEPNMATMLCFVLTDLHVNQTALKAALKAAVDESFNSITVDGDCSTNDTVLALANGEAGGGQITRTSRHFGALVDAMRTVCESMARMIVRDGEGATKLIEITLEKVRSEAQAGKGARALANSLLFKTAMYGNDPNWGRIMAALGASGITMAEEKVDVYFGRTKVVSGGLATGRDADARKALEGDEIKVRVVMNTGQQSGRILTCDLTEKYIQINAEYTT